MSRGIGFRRASRLQLEVEPRGGEADQADDEFLRDLHRRVGWQAAVAYGMPLAETEALVAPEPEPKPHLVLVSERAPEPAPEPSPASRSGALPTVAELELMIDERRGADPTRAADWQWSLRHLREFADDEGTLPEDFRATVEVVFGELLEATA